MRSGIREIRRPNSPEPGTGGAACERGDGGNQTCTPSSNSPESWEPVSPEQERKPGTLRQAGCGDHTHNRQLNPKRTAIIGSGPPLPNWGSPALCQAEADPWAVGCPGLSLKGRRYHGQKRAQQPLKFTVTLFSHL